MSTSTVTVANPAASWSVVVQIPSSAAAVSTPPLDTYVDVYTDAYMDGYVPG